MGDIKQLLNSADLHGNTPIMMAAKYASKGIIMLLLDNMEVGILKSESTQKIRIYYDIQVDLEAVDNMGRNVSYMIR